MSPLILTLPDTTRTWISSITRKHFKLGSPLGGRRSKLKLKLWPSRAWGGNKSIRPRFFIYLPLSSSFFQSFLSLVLHSFSANMYTTLLASLSLASLVFSTPIHASTPLKVSISKRFSVSDGTGIANMTAIFHAVDSAKGWASFFSSFFNGKIACSIFFRRLYENTPPSYQETTIR